jgi:hypothetical protein
LSLLDHLISFGLTLLSNFSIRKDAGIPVFIIHIYTKKTNMIIISIGMVFAIVIIIIIIIITTITAAVSIVLENGIILMRAMPKWSKIQL